MTTRSINSSVPQTIQTVQVSATESAQPAPGSAKPANMSVRVAPNQNAEANCGYIEWNGKKYQIFVKNKKGQLLSTENRNWSSIIQNQTKFLQAQQDALPANFKAAKWNLQTGEADYETLSDISDKKDAPSATNVNVTKTSDRIKSASIASFTNMCESIKHSKMRLSTKPLPAPPPSLVSPPRTPVITPTHSERISGTYRQSNYKGGSIKAGDGNSSCAVNAGRALIRMLNPTTHYTTATMDGILHDGITEYQRLISIYRRSGFSQPADRVNNPLLGTEFVATSDPEWQRHLDLVVDAAHDSYIKPHVGDLRSEGAKVCFDRMLTILENSCPNGESRGASLLIKDGTYAVKVSKDSSGKVTYQFYDPHGGGSNDAACLMKFSNREALVYFLAGKYKAVPHGRNEDNQVGMTIVKLKDPSVAAQPPDPALRPSPNPIPPHRHPSALARPLPPPLPSGSLRPRLTQ